MDTQINMRRLWSLPILAILAAGPGACDRDEIRTLEVPKETPVVARVGEPLGPLGAAPPAANGGTPAWTTPQGWREGPAGGMRFATLFAGPPERQAEATVIALGPESGDIPANVNRWRGQVGLGPLGDSELRSQIVQITVDGGTATLVDIEGAAEQEPRQRMLAAILPRADRIWFLKMLGPHDTVGQEKQNFGSWVNSVRFGGGAAGQGPAIPTTPAAPGDPMKSGPPVSGAPAGLLTGWTTPEGWHQDANPAPPRLASFHVHGGDPAPEVTITAFPGDTGGVLANVNRWRGQVGLPPVEREDQIERQVIDLPGGPATLVDLIGPAGDAPSANRILAALVPRHGQTFFVKMTGPEVAVGAQRASFEAFVRSLQFAEPRSGATAVD